MVTGNFEKYKDRKLLERLLISKGAVDGGLSKNLDYLIVGEGAGPAKINKAKELIAAGAKLKIISEENLYKFLD